MLIKTIIKKIVSYVNCRKVMFIIKLNGRHNTVFLTLLNNKNPKILIVLLPIDQIVLALKFWILFLFWFCIFFSYFSFFSSAAGAAGWCWGIEFIFVCLLPFLALRALNWCFLPCPLRRRLALAFTRILLYASTKGGTYNISCISYRAWGTTSLTRASRIHILSFQNIL